MADWITIGVVSVVVLFALAVFYRALKEPLDLIIYWIYKGLLWVKSGFTSATTKAVDKADEIVYQ